MIKTAKSPKSIAEEHSALHDKLKELIQLPGKTGKAAAKLATLLHPHFLKEEEFALPPLSLLPDLAQGKIQPEMEEYIAVCEKLVSNLPEMMKEHDAIKKQLTELEEAAKQENCLQAQEFAVQLKTHALNEEEILYPTTILIGEYLKLLFDTE